MDEKKIDSPALRDIQRSNAFGYHEKQSKHNFRLAQSLFHNSTTKPVPSEQFLDWVVTTSFYAALHFVSAELVFRVNVRLYENTIGFDSIEAVTNRLRNRVQLKLPTETVQGRHETLKRLVKDNFDPLVALAYNQLFDEAKISRYRRFPWDDRERTNACLLNCKKIEDWFDGFHPAKTMPLKTSK